MTRHISLLLLIVLTLASCETKKSYKYIEVVEEVGVMGGTSTREKEAEIINASNDTTAYLEAYQSFCISQKVNKDMKTSLGKTYSTPKEFKLLNDKGIDIINSVVFVNKSQREKEIEDKVFSLGNSVQESLDANKKDAANKFKETSKIDSSKVKELTKYFRQKKDEYSTDNKIWYKPKSSPEYANANGIYCYFCTENGIPNNLRFKLQYYADDWLFFKSVQFSVDEKAFEFIPLKTETDNGDGGYIWEWFDEALSSSDKDLIYALANAKSAKMKLNGRQYYKEKIITQEQINSIKRTLDLYHSMGGQY